MPFHGRRRPCRSETETGRVTWTIQVGPVASQGPYKRKAGDPEAGEETWGWKKVIRVLQPQTKESKWPPEAREGKAQILPSHFQKEHSSADTLISDLSLPQLRGCICVAYAGIHINLDLSS